MESIKASEQQCEIMQLKQSLSGKSDVIRELQEEIENMVIRKFFKPKMLYFRSST